MTGQLPTVPTGIRRTAEYARLFRREPSEPEPFYRYLAADTVRLVGARHRLDGARVLDVGGGPGYLQDAFDAAGADCVVLDYSPGELRLHGREPRRAVVGDAARLPFADRTIDVVVSSNVLEHVPSPQAMLRESVRVLRDDGVAVVAFTNWLSPWGGHETSPWHYLGGHRAARRYQRRRGEPPKNRYGAGLYPVHIGTTLRWLRKQPDIELLDAFPRYWPEWARPVLRVPALREIVTWNLVLVLCRRGLNPAG